MRMTIFTLKICCEDKMSSLNLKSFVNISNDDDDYNNRKVELSAYNMPGTNLAWHINSFNFHNSLVKQVLSQ